MTNERIDKQRKCSLLFKECEDRDILAINCNLYLHISIINRRKDIKEFLLLIVLP